ncbi:hypothetical protein K437DRAFT_126152 [Tilletiaria anomala UBC 951]|uniref:Uncharacterized protein n=1 Tax=Tilletiaria anomala (strain ATCC 24038 / CBS 436.72 / UBC 951) TaxID=1037660 RepID=A0A066W2R7_TILAU|nr:uncharacterized protein K437DRAFT_126152 [Tilletiaria anomala UBC 951]KDN45095.1 hypothetical protein K437DRAFT_126152 [Tilletiaria anomala UBC 951]
MGLVRFMAALSSASSRFHVPYLLIGRSKRGVTAAAQQYVHKTYVQINNLGSTKRRGKGPNFARILEHHRKAFHLPASFFGAARAISVGNLGSVPNGSKEGCDHVRHVQLAAEFRKTSGICNDHQRLLVVTVAKNRTSQTCRRATHTR